MKGLHPIPIGKSSTKPYSTCNNLAETDRIVARDGLFRASWEWKAGRNASVKATTTSHISAYAHTFLMEMGVWLSAANQRLMRAEVFDLPEKRSAPGRSIRS